MKTRTVEERIALGDWAKNLLQDSNFNGVCNGIIADAMAGLLSTMPGSDKATQLHMELMAADRFKGALRALENDASMARNELKTRSQHSGTT